MVDIDAEIEQLTHMEACLNGLYARLRADGCLYVDEVRALVNQRAALAVRLGIAAILQEMEMELVGDREHK